MKSPILMDVDQSAIVVAEQVMEIRIETATDYLRAVESLKIITELRDKIDAVFNPIISRAHAAHKEALSQKKGVMGKLEPAEQHLRKEIGRFQAEERQKFAAYEGSEDAGVSNQQELSRLGSVPAVPGVSTRRNWKYRVKDINLVPREYLCLDEARVGSVVRALRDMTKIPGIEVYSEDTVSVRRDK